MLRSFPLQLPVPNLDRPVGGVGDYEAFESGGDGVNGVVMGADGFQAFQIGDSPYFQSLIPRFGI